MVNAICEELRIKSTIIDAPIQTIYLGGGTPSLLSSKELDAIFISIEKYYSLNQNQEITIEVNPDDVDKNFVQLIRDSPINRLSLGIQSFFNDDLQYMNRAHNAEEARRSVELCLSTGIDNITADLIYGVPGLSHRHWHENIDILASYDIPHMSCYQLTVEDKTPLEAFIERGAMESPNDEHAVEQFYILLDKMSWHGYEAYEISNYAKPGFRSKHNSAYWQSEPYLGFGPSAHSYYNKQRSWNTVVNKRYMESLEANELEQESELLTLENQYNEFVLTRLRTIEGISIKKINQLFPIYLEQFNKNLAAPLQNKLIKEIDNHIILTRKGKVWADAVSAGLMI